MTWVRTVNEQEAEGKVKEIYAAFKEQVGFVPNIMRLFSFKPRSLEATASMFKAFMYGGAGYPAVKCIAKPLRTASFAERS